MVVGSLSESSREFDRAHSQAALQDLLAHVRGESPDLLPFEAVRQRLRLSHPSYRGLQDVPLDEIIGSVGRYRDFTRKFLPRRKSAKDRWSRVDKLAFDRGMPPIELYKVGEAYFVLDGNHRVSVARRAKMPTIQAHVWEYQTRVPLDADTTLDDLLIKQEYQEFLERTGLDESRPEQKIEFTTPGGYRELTYWIALYQAALSQIDGRPFGYQEAATYWYDMIYTTVVQIIRQRDMLEGFPHRTEADLFVWVMRHQRELSAASGDTVPMTEATDHIVDQYGRKWPRRFLDSLKGRLLG